MTRRLTQPMLGEAVAPAQLPALRYPLWLSNKFDGIRALDLEQGLMSRKLKPIRNAELRERYSSPKFLWLDGELIAGNPLDPLCYTNTADIVNDRLAPASSVRFFVFDWVQPSMLDTPYHERYAELRDTFLRRQLGKHNCVLVAQRHCHRAAKVEYHEELAVGKGYEGVMLRDPLGVYKCGRSTVPQQLLLKLKRFEDSEAVILAVYERQKNTNAQVRDERGYAKRSSAKAGKVGGSGLVGSFRVRDLKTKQEFSCGTGKIPRERLRLAEWKPGTIIKYRFQPAGVKELPRFPRCIGRRDKGDM